MKIQNKDLKNLNDKGATVIEMSIVLLVFITVLFLIIDFSRILWVKSALIKSTQNAARRAASIDGLGYNTYKAIPEIQADMSGGATNFDTGAELDSAIESVGDFYMAKADVERHAYGLINIVANLSPAASRDDSVMRDMANESWAMLLPYTYDTYDRDFNSDTRVADVAIIRPGEEVNWADPITGDEIVDRVTFHPGLCRDGGSHCAAVANCMDYNDNRPCKDLNDTNIRIDGSIDIEKVYERYPLMAEMRAEVSTIILGPLFGMFQNNNGKITIDARAFAYREQAPRGSSPLGKPIGPPTFCLPDGCETDPTQVWNFNICNCQCDFSNLCPDGATRNGDCSCPDPNRTTETTVPQNNQDPEPEACDPNFSDCDNTTNTTVPVPTTTTEPPPVLPRPPCPAGAQALCKNPANFDYANCRCGGGGAA